ncbi:hypothetical protein MASR1M107_14590 [Ignavibacteriales bacterium]
MLSKTLLLMILSVSTLLSQSVFFDFATLARKDSFYNELKLKIIECQKPANFKNADIMANGLWAAELTMNKSSEFKTFLSSMMDSLQKFDADIQRRLLQTAFTLYRGEFKVAAEKFAKITTNIKLFAMAVNYCNLNVSEMKQYEELAKTKFAKDINNPILQALIGNLSFKSNGGQSLPPISDLLNYGKDTSVFRMFMFIRNDRNYAGKIIFRSKKGEFLRDSSGKLVTLSYFARALPNMPGYLTNGNSPQGVFSMTGVYNSPAKLIGPTPRIRLFMPSETDNNTFYNTRASLKGESDSVLYRKLFPESWRNYFPVMESYYAGKAGRFDIVMHGTTVDQRYYVNEVFYPNVPTHGCLSGVEIWDDRGILIQSDQQKLLDIYASLGNPKGFLYLIELNDEKRIVTDEDIENLFK